jgi:hypothetical protein
VDETRISKGSLEINWKINGEKEYLREARKSIGK